MPVSHSKTCLITTFIRNIYNLLGNLNIIICILLSNNTLSITLCAYVDFCDATSIHGLCTAKVFQVSKCNTVHLKHHHTRTHRRYLYYRTANCFKGHKQISNKLWFNYNIMIKQLPHWQSHKAHLKYSLIIKLKSIYKEGVKHRNK